MKQSKNNSQETVPESNRAIGGAGPDMKFSKLYKASTFAEAQKLCPRGYRMLEIWELVKLASENHPIIFDTEKGKWIFFWSATKYKDFGVRGVDRFGDGVWGAFWVNLDYSYAYGRVFFVKKENKK